MTHYFALFLFWYVWASCLYQSFNQCIIVFAAEVFWLKYFYVIEFFEWRGNMGGKGKGGGGSE